MNVSDYFPTRHPPQLLGDAYYPGSDALVRVVETATGWEITNGLTGFRVPKHQATNVTQPPLAPLQGIRWRDGTWTATGPNYLQRRSWYEEPLPPDPVTDLTVTALVETTLRVVVEVRYTVNRSAFEYPTGTVLIPGGPGYHRTTLTLEAGQPSILVEEEGDCDIGYTLVVSAGLAPDQARYRGHVASDAAHGREPDGSKLKPTHERGYRIDAVVDLNEPTKVSYNTNVGCRPPLAVWNPWAADSGWYWQLYNHQAPASANLFGIFAGRASRALGCVASGAGIWNGQITAGVTVELNRCSPALQLAPSNRFAWGIFVGTKADLLPPEQVQPIGRQLNLHGGFDLEKLAAIPAAPANLSTPSTNPQVREIVQLADDLIAALVNGDGVYDFRWHYWQGGVELARQIPTINQLLADDRTSPADRAHIQAAAALFATVLWDDDFVPLQKDEAGNLLHGLNLGTANMPQQYGGYRDQYALLLGKDPAWTSRAVSASKSALDGIRAALNEAGAPGDNPWYMHASLLPHLLTLLQARELGFADGFATEPLLAKFAEFALQLLTPPDPRYAGWRKLISFGDGATESSGIHGILATGFWPSNPALAERLQRAWRVSGSRLDSFFGSLEPFIDEMAPGVNLALGSADFPGYLTCLRSEGSAVWLLDGDHLSETGHRQYDRGQLAAYLLGAPISQDWAGCYTPQTSGAVHKSLLLPESYYPADWKTADLALDAGRPGWSTSTSGRFIPEPGGGSVRAAMSDGRGLTWTREVWLRTPEPGYQLLAVRDYCAAPSILTWHLLTTGPMELAAGLAISPSARTWPELPRAGVPFVLPAGTNRLGFMGQWGVDLDVYLVGDEPLDGWLGNWGHGWAPTTEDTEFRQAQGRPFEIRQHVLRLRSPAGRFFTLIVPRKAGTSLPLTVRPEGDQVRVFQTPPGEVFGGRRAQSGEQVFG